MLAIGSIGIAQCRKDIKWTLYHQILSVFSVILLLLSIILTLIIQSVEVASVLFLFFNVLSIWILGALTLLRCDMQHRLPQCFGRV